jgi:dsDNA-binding SOS-regulon protein
MNTVGQCPSTCYQAVSAVRNYTTREINDLAAKYVEVLRENLKQYVSNCSICPFKPMPSKITLWFNAQGELAALWGTENYRKILDRTVLSTSDESLQYDAWEKRLKFLGLHAVKIKFHVYDKMENDNFFTRKEPASQLPNVVNDMVNVLLTTLNKTAAASDSKAKQESLSGRFRENRWFLAFAEPETYPTSTLPL